MNSWRKLLEPFPSDPQEFGPESSVSSGVLDTQPKEYLTGKGRNMKRQQSNCHGSDREMG